MRHRGERRMNVLPVVQRDVAHRWLRLVAAVCVVAVGWRCTAVNEVTVRPIVLNGIYSGSQDGTDAGAAFIDDPLLFFLQENGDSVVGTFEGGGIQTGNFRASIDRTNGFFLDIVMELVSPCAGEYLGTAEVRQGVQFNGQTRIGIAGSYAGTYCDGDFEADFIVQEVI